MRIPNVSISPIKFIQSNPIQSFRKLKKFAPLILSASLAGILSGSVAQAAVINWVGGADGNWATAENWTGGTPDAGNDILFDNAGAQDDFSTNNFLTQDLTISSLTYSNFSYSLPDSEGPFSSHHTEIRNGSTLTVTNGLTVGVSSTIASKDFVSNVFTYATISGADATLAVTGGNIRVGYQSSGASTTTRTLYGQLDMSRLSNFIQDTPYNTFGIASHPQRRQSGRVYLAENNSITVSNLYIGLGITGAGTSPANIHLGQNNIFNANLLLVGQDTEGNMNFQDGLTNPTLKIRGTNGISRVGSIYMAATFGASSVYGRGTNDLTAGIIDVAATNLFIAYHSGDTSGSSQVTRGRLMIGSSSSNSVVVKNLTIGSNPGGPTPTRTSQCYGFLDMDGGTFTAETVVVGYAKNAGTANGTINLSGGTFTAETLSVGTWDTSGTADGFINLSGGTMRIAGDLIVGEKTFFSLGSVCTVDSSTFGIGGQIGSPIANLSRLILNQATLELGLGGETNVGAYIEELTLDATNTIVITSSNLALGQFPIIAYQLISGSGGFAGLSLSVPPGVSASLVDNSGNQTIDLLVTAVPAVAPVLSSCTLVSPNTYKILGSGEPNQSYQVYMTTNIELPMNQWSAVGPVNADANGVIQFLDSAADTQRFYRLGY